jgi:hypothetical protein
LLGVAKRVCVVIGVLPLFPGRLTEHDFSGQCFPVSASRATVVELDRCLGLRSLSQMRPMHRRAPLSAAESALPVEFFGFQGFAALPFSPRPTLSLAVGWQFGWHAAFWATLCIDPTPMLATAGGGWRRASLPLKNTEDPKLGLKFCLIF